MQTRCVLLSLISWTSALTGAGVRHAVVPAWAIPHSGRCGKTSRRLCARHVRLGHAGSRGDTPLLTPSWPRCFWLIALRDDFPQAAFPTSPNPHRHLSPRLGTVSGAAGFALLLRGLKKSSRLLPPARILRNDARPAERGAVSVVVLRCAPIVPGPEGPPKLAGGVSHRDRHPTRTRPGGALEIAVLPPPHPGRNPRWNLLGG